MSGKLSDDAIRSRAIAGANAPAKLVSLELDVPERTANYWINSARAAGWLAGMTSNVGRPADP